MLLGFGSMALSKVILFSDHIGMDVFHDDFLKMEGI